MRMSLFSSSIHRLSSISIVSHYSHPLSSYINNCPLRKYNIQDIIFPHGRVIFLEYSSSCRHKRQFSSALFTGESDDKFYITPVVIMSRVRGAAGPSPSPAPALCLCSLLIPRRRHMHAPPNTRTFFLLFFLIVTCIVSLPGGMYHFLACLLSNAAPISMPYCHCVDLYYPHRMSFTSLIFMLAVYIS